jgi:hypothetical protein
VVDGCDGEALVAGRGDGEVVVAHGGFVFVLVCFAGLL